jgi:hypothetical protein
VRLWASLGSALDSAKRLSPDQLRRLADAKLSDLVAKEIGRSRTRVRQLEKRYPSAAPRELGQRLIDDKKGVAGMLGGVSGVFGIFSVPADLLLMAWVELVLLVDLATVYKVNLKAHASRQELLDLYGQTHGYGKLARSGPRALGSAAAALFARGGLRTVGRAVPVVAAPISAWLNNQHIQKVGEEALRHFEGFGKAHHKTRGGEA